MTHQQPWKNGNAARGGSSRGRKSSEMFAATVLNSNRAVPLIGTDSFNSPAPRRCWPARPALGERWPFRLVATAEEDRLNFRRNPLAGSEICDLFRGCAPNVYHRSMIIVPHGAPEGYEWFVTLVVVVGLYFAVRNFMRARR